jgi:photosystem II stability/assembly factor-like uncharacterized protein
MQTNILKIIKAYFTIFLIGLSFFTQAQLPINDELKILLTGKNKFADIMQTVNTYYNQKNYSVNQKLSSEFKKWNRWAWYEARHIDNNGNFVDATQKNYDIAKKITASNLDRATVANSGNWFNLGPVNVVFPGGSVSAGIGRVDRIAFHPTNSNIIFAGSPAGGLWKTDDGGLNWYSISEYIPGLGVSGIVVDKNNPNIIYVLTGNGDDYSNALPSNLYRKSIGIMKTIDGGNTWTQLPLPISFYNYYGFKLVQMPNNTNILLAATSQGLFRTTNAGNSWVMVSDFNEDIFDIEISPANPAIVFYTKSNFIYKSRDFGATFTPILSGAFNPSYFGSTITRETAISVSPNDPTALFVNFSNSNQLYYSNDTGNTFTRRNAASPPTVRYTNAFTVNPINASKILVGNIGVNTSTDGGVTFPISGAAIHADIHDLQYSPINNILYSATDGGVYKSNDDGANWIPLHNGMNTTMYYHMGCKKGSSSDLLLAGSQDNGMHLRNNSSIFSNINGGDGFDAKFLNNSNVAFYSLNAQIAKYTVSTNSAVQALIPPGAANINDQVFFFPHIEIHPTNDNIIYAGYGTSIFRSTTGGNFGSWTNIGSSASSGFGSAGGLAVSANNPDRLYAANGTTLQISNDKGTTWATISGTNGWPASSGVITDIRSRTNNADEIWVTFGSYDVEKVLYSGNAGTSWINFTGSLPNLPVYCIDYTDDGDAYIGTDAGIYFMDFAMNDWVPFSNGMPIIPVTELFVDITNNSIKAATFGRGIWKSDLYSNCAASLNLVGTSLGTNLYQASGLITTTQDVTGSFGNNNKYRSPTKIQFLPGFKSKENSYLHAIIGPCGQGVFSKNGASINKIVGVVPKVIM